MTTYLKLRLILFLSILLPLMAIGQLERGDKVPEITLSKLLNHTDSSVRLSAFKGKLVLLDFWTFYCPVCLDAFPKLDSLQQKYKDRIQIIAVNAATQKATLAFFEKRKKLHFPRFLMVTEDTILSQLFPRNFNPWMVWIDGNGIVKHMTLPGPDLELDIHAFLNGGKLLSRELHYAKPDPGKPLIAKENGRWLSKIRYYSTISNCINEVSVGNQIIADDGKGEPGELTANCKSVVELLVDAHAEGSSERFLLGANIQLNVKDSTRFIRPIDPRKQDSWQDSNSYTYQLSIPGKNKAQLCEIFKTHVQNYFNVESFVEKRTVRTLGVIKTGEPSILVAVPDSAFQVMPFYSLHSLMRQNALQQKIPGFINGVDSLGMQTMVRIKDKTINHMNIADLEKELKLNGFALVTREWLTDVLVINEK